MAYILWMTDNLDTQIQTLLQEVKQMQEDLIIDMDGKWFVSFSASEIMRASTWLKANVTTPWGARTLVIEDEDVTGIVFVEEADAFRFREEFK